MLNTKEVIVKSDKTIKDVLYPNEPINIGIKPKNRKYSDFVPNTERKFESSLWYDGEVNSKNHPKSNMFWDKNIHPITGIRKHLCQN